MHFKIRKCHPEFLVKQLQGDKNILNGNKCKVVCLLVLKTPLNHFNHSSLPNAKKSMSDSTMK